MKRILVLLLLVLPAFTAFYPAFVSAQELNGARVYSNHCGTCHQARAPSEFSDRAWAVIVHHMHTRGYLTREEMKAVRKFLLDNNSTVAAVTLAAPPFGGTLDGKALVAKNGCQGCHIIKGKGGNIGPNLDTLYSRRDQAYLVKKLTNPKFDNPRSVMPVFRLSQAQKEAIAEYLKQ